VTANPLPLPFRAPGRALVAPEELIIVISSSEKDEMTPDVEPAFTVAPDSGPAVEVGQGGTRPLACRLGASAIHSALELAHPEQVWVVEKLSPGAT